MRLDGLDDSKIAWNLGNPVDSQGWRSSRTAMVAALLPHIRQFVRVRQALVCAEARNTTVTALLDNPRIGVVQLDRRGLIMAVNDRARGILRRGDGLADRNGMLYARASADRVGFDRLVGDALPTSGAVAVSGSMLVRRSAVLPPFVVHVKPVGVPQPDYGARHVALLVLIVEPAHHQRVDPGLVATTLGLTPGESQVAVWLAEPPAERRRRRRLPAPPHRRVRDRSRAGRLQRRARRRCGATTASRHTKRRTPTCGPCSAAASQRANVQEPEEQEPSGDQAHAVSEADHAEGAPVALRLQDDHLAADGAAGLKPQALDEAAVLHRGADRLTVDVEPGHDPERPVIAAMQAPDPSAQRESERRPHSVDGRRVPTPGSGQRAPVGSAPTAADRGPDPPQPEPATCASAGVPRGRPGENLEKAVPVMNNTGARTAPRDDAR